jgi:hypothetical protein
MDTELLVDNQIEDGRRIVAQLVDAAIDVTVAFWIKTSDEGLWFLYIGSKLLDSTTTSDAYRRVYSCLSQIPDVAVGLSEIKLVNPTSPIARDAIAIRDRRPARLPTRYHGNHLGNVSIEEAYIYPPATGPMTIAQVLQTVLGLMNRTGILQPSSVTLRDGTTIQAIPTAIDMQTPGTVRITLTDISTGNNQVVSASDVTNIR